MFNTILWQIRILLKQLVFSQRVTYLKGINNCSLSKAKTKKKCAVSLNTIRCIGPTNFELDKAKL